MEIIVEVLEETIMMLPMLFFMYFVLEYLERHQLDIFDKIKDLGPLYGAILGIIPQCGISVVVSLLFLEGKVSIGTLISVYIATSDEAIPLLLASPESYSTTIYIIVLKLILGVLFGYLIDLFVKSKIDKTSITYHHNEHSLMKCVIERTMKVYVFIIVVHILLSYLFNFIGQKQLSVLLLNQSMLQPVISSIFGLIPHCVVSIVLSQLYTQQLLSFASLISGLMTNGGMGLIVLVQNKAGIKIIGKIIGLLLICSIITGIFLTIICKYI